MAAAVEGAVRGAGAGRAVRVALTQAMYSKQPQLLFSCSQKCRSRSRLRQKHTGADTRAAVRTAAGTEESAAGTGVAADAAHSVGPPGVPHTAVEKVVKVIEAERTRQLTGHAGQRRRRTGRETTPGLGATVLRQRDLLAGDGKLLAMQLLVQSSRLSPVAAGMPPWVVSRTRTTPSPLLRWRLASLAAKRRQKLQLWPALLWVIGNRAPGPSSSLLSSGWVYSGLQAPVRLEMGLPQVVRGCSTGRTAPAR
jgi:hypothetical protein